MVQFIIPQELKLETVINCFARQKVCSSMYLIHGSLPLSELAPLSFSLTLSLSDQRNNERLRVRRPEEKNTRFL